MAVRKRLSLHLSCLQLFNAVDSHLSFHAVRQNLYKVFASQISGPGTGMTGQEALTDVSNPNSTLYGHHHTMAGLQRSHKVSWYRPTSYGYAEYHGK